MATRGVSTTLQSDGELVPLLKRAAAHMSLPLRKGHQHRTPRPDSGMRRLVQTSAGGGRGAARFPRPRRSARAPARQPRASVPRDRGTPVEIHPSASNPRPTTRPLGGSHHPRSLLQCGVAWGVSPCALDSAGRPSGDVWFQYFSTVARHKKTQYPRRKTEGCNAVASVDVQTRGTVSVEAACATTTPTQSSVRSESTTEGLGLIDQGGGPMIRRKSLSAFEMQSDTCATRDAQRTARHVQLRRFRAVDRLAGAVEQNHDGREYDLVLPLSTITPTTDRRDGVHAANTRAPASASRRASAFHPSSADRSLGSPRNVKHGGSTHRFSRVATSTGSSAMREWSHAITQTYPAYAWAYDGTTTRPSRGCPGSPRPCPACCAPANRDDALYESANAAKSVSVSIQLTLAARQRYKPSVAIRSGAVKTAHPARGTYYSQINGQRQLTRLRIATRADTRSDPQERGTWTRSPDRPVM